MDSEEQLDYGEEEEEEEEKEKEDGYDDVNVGQGFAEPAAPSGNGGLPDRVADGLIGLGVPVVGPDGNGSVSGSGALQPELKFVSLLPGEGPDGIPRRSNSEAWDAVRESDGGSIGFRGNSALAPLHSNISVDPEFGNASSSLPSDPGNDGAKSQPLMPPNPPAIATGDHPMTDNSLRTDGDRMDDNGSTLLFVGKLHWWTTDVELESVLLRYGRVKEVKFFDEKTSGKSKGYCQVEFYDSTVAAACKEGMNGHVFNGRPCVVVYASPQTLKKKKMGVAHMNKNQAQTHAQTQGRRLVNEGISRGCRINHQSGDGGDGFAGRGRQRYQNRGQGSMRGRGGVSAKGVGWVTGGLQAIFPQGFARPGFGNLAGDLIHSQGLMGAVFEPAYHGRGGPFGGFSGPAFPSMAPPFHAVTPHVNQSFFGCGVAGAGMGMIRSSGMEGNSTGMWTDTSMGGWKVTDNGRRMKESSYGGGDNCVSDYGHKEVCRKRSGRSNIPQDKEEDPEHAGSENFERGHLYKMEKDWDRSDKEHYREEKNRDRGQEQRDQDYNNEDNLVMSSSSSRSQSNFRMAQEVDHGFGLREVADYGKRRRIPLESRSP
ncbi:hypothetical protein B296_00046314 [Ensete ventricosum]|uniref:RRM domain-containing protein n=1 Tax=Ensete ventricosum TaxID=4639 RepID=A0A426XE71_ENSVE|nr:hypothetical protein B296_00046314 [Ensete ventricosum]